MNLVTFSAGSFILRGAANQLANSAKRVNIFDEVNSVGLTDLAQDFPDEVNLIIAQFERYNIGFGWWAWKPLVIERELKQLENSQVLLYLDAGCYFVSDEQIKDAIETINSSPIEFDIIVQHVKGHGAKKYGSEEFKWTKPSTLKLLTNPNDANSPQWAATWILIKKNSRTTNLIEEWRKVSFKDEFSLIKSSSPDFAQDSLLIKHQCDQSVLSVLIKNNPNLIVDTLEVSFLRQKLDAVIVMGRNRSPLRFARRPQLNNSLQKFFYYIFLVESKVREMLLVRKIVAFYYRKVY